MEIRSRCLDLGKFYYSPIEDFVNNTAFQFSRVSTSVLLPIPESVVIVSQELASMAPFCNSIILKTNNSRVDIKVSIEEIRTQTDRFWWVPKLYQRVASLTFQLDSKFGSLRKASVPFFLSRHLKHWKKAIFLDIKESISDYFRTSVVKISSSLHKY